MLFLLLFLGSSHGYTGTAGRCITPLRLCRKLGSTPWALYSASGPTASEMALPARAGAPGVRRAPKKEQKQHKEEVLNNKKKQI